CGDGCEQTEWHGEPARAPAVVDRLGPRPADQQRGRWVEREEVRRPFARGQAEEHEPRHEPAEWEQERGRRRGVVRARRLAAPEAAPRVTRGLPGEPEGARDEQAPGKEARREVAEVLVPGSPVHPAPGVPLHLLVHEGLPEIAGAVAGDGRSVPGQYD